VRAQAQQGLLPPYGTDIRVGDLRDAFARSFQDNPPVATDRAWALTPAIDITETYDSATQTRHGFRKDYVTRISPSVAGTITTRRLDAALYYSPTIAFYALSGGQNGVAHNLNSSATITAIEDLLYLDLRGYAAVQPVLGYATAPGDTGGGGNEVQTMSFSASPYLRYRFGDTATVRLAYAITRNMTSADNLSPTVAALAGVNNNNYTSHQQSLNILSGPDFGRIQVAFDAAAVQYDGTGTLKGAHNETAALSAGYALTRTFTVTGSIGHENIVYGAASGIKPITGITWSGGFRWAPNADSVINASYGHQQGATSFAFDGSYAPTARLRLSARYSQGVGTGEQFLQNAIAGTGVGPAGILVDRTTGAPVQLGNYFGQQQGIYRTTSASFSATLLGDRDIYTLAIDKTERRLLSGGTGPGIGSNDGLNGSLAWQHSLTQSWSTNTVLQYGTRSVPGAGSNATVTGSISTSYALSEDVSTNFLYSHSETSGPSFGLAPTRDLAVVGVHKAF
jgi:uncharacterized protein (PEP-CTERM system associated)